MSYVTTVSSVVIRQLAILLGQLACIVAVREKMTKISLVFWKLLLNHGESENEFYIPKFGLIHSFPMVYHTHHSHKWFENFFRKNTENAFEEFLVFWILFKNYKDFGTTINIQKFRLFSSYPTVCHLHHSDERFKNYDKKIMQKMVLEKVRPTVN